MGFSILGLGTALPLTAIRQDESVVLNHIISGVDGPERDLVAQIFANTTIQKRYTVLPRAIVDDLLAGTNTTDSAFVATAEKIHEGADDCPAHERFIRYAPGLADRAAKQALTNAQISSNEITHLVTVSCTGFSAPGWDFALIRSLRLPPTVQRTHIGFMGCHGAFNGLRVARAFAEADESACVLVCAVEACSLHCQYEGSPKQLIANALFADGAGAVVGRKAKGRRWTVHANGSCLLPDCAEAMTWDIGDHGFQMTLSSKVPELICRHLRPWLEQWLNSLDLSVAGVGSWAIHPGGPRILDAVETALQLPSQTTATSRAVLAECGNMSSPTVLFILERFQRENAPLPCVALGFGPGLTVEAALLV